MKKSECRIIIADDEDHVRALLRTVVQIAGLQLAGEAANGQEALDLYAELKPDLMLLDINMPVKNGDEVLRELLEQFPDAKVIMLTSVADRETVTNCIAHGALNYILKGSPVEEISRAIEEALESLPQH